MFEANFVFAMVPKQLFPHLWAIHQNDSESLRSYVKRFNDEAQKVNVLLNQVATQIFMQSLNADEINDTFTVGMHYFSPHSFSDLMFEA